MSSAASGGGVSGGGGGIKIGGGWVEAPIPSSGLISDTSPGNKIIMVK